MKRILVALALTFGAVAAQAQDSRIGVKISGGIAKFRGDDVTNQSNTLSAGGGLVYNIKLTEMLSVQPELLYTVKGSRFNSDAFDSKTTLHYVELPVMLRATFSNVFVEAGPQVGYLVAAKLEVTPNNGGEASEDKSRNNFTNADWGFAAGIGYQLENGLSLTGRYSGSLNPVLPNVASTKIKAYNSAFLVQLGFLLPQGN
ncbi:porin family protein [Hymenobacter canadensis]|uniref:Porin family protein n=1 Tax=Hymenobacter canadensis TaxID=2999067 RepID=A0ABY7LQ19_9BACT|nr:porin family protein [Hymenobacter canadensis]WBA41939.1 porin family protein [Hymenobacter canadensis]